MRTREFDENKIIEAAMLAFWKKGYAETSLADLQDATGLGKASLYNAFESKEHLFQLTLKKYLAEIGVYYDKLLNSDSDPKKALTNLLHGIVTAASKPPRGCLLILSIQNKTEHSTANKKIFELALNAREERLFKVVSKLHVNEKQARILTQSLCTFIDGLLSSTRAGEHAEALHERVDFTLERMLKN